MIASMTGFASQSRDYDYGQLNLEIRTVNHRYLEIQFRLPDELRSLETGLRDAIGAKIARGKVDCRIGFAPIPSAAKGLPLNDDVLKQLIKYNESIKSMLPSSAPLSVSNILNFPGIFEQDTPPDAIIATATAPGATKRTMPLCMFPEAAVYRGSGDVNDAGNWSCTANTGMLRAQGGKPKKT